MDLPSFNQTTDGARDDRVSTDDPAMRKRAASASSPSAQRTQLLFTGDPPSPRHVLANHDPDLTNAEIDRICEGLTQNAAKVRYLEAMGLTVRRKPNGRPLVNRVHYDAVCGGGGALAAADATGGAGINWTR